MENETSCPICYREYGPHLPKDGVQNHIGDDDKVGKKNYTCPHYFCSKCLTILCFNAEDKCPLCRKNMYPLLESYIPEDGFWCECCDLDKRENPAYKKKFFRDLDKEYASDSDSDSDSD